MITNLRMIAFVPVVSLALGPLAPGDPCGDGLDQLPSLRDPRPRRRIAEQWSDP